MRAVRGSGIRSNRLQVKQLAIVLESRRTIGEYFGNLIASESRFTPC